jgi:tRNA 5-methylaminomethyl-2-thiouridine biosynthesis bifunctional protein
MSSAQLKKFALVRPADIEWRNNLPYSLEFEDVYYSDCGALEESEHVFLKGCQLESDWLNQAQDNFIIAELGFGSGLNFLNAASLWQDKITSQKHNQNKHLNYISIEKRPFSLEDFIKSCDSWPEFKTLSQALIRQYPSTTYGRHQIVFESRQLTLTLFFMPAEDAFKDLINESEAQQNKIQIDHWFLDGFAPAKNESMWGLKIMQNIASLSKIGSRLSTYSVAGSVKRPISESGFKITKQKGFGRKREMLTAKLEVKQHSNYSKYINIKYESPWFNQSLSEKTESVAIIGGGIAGCATAYSLAQKGFKVDIFESHSQLAKEASGAAAGIFHPQLTSDMNINSQFNWLAYLYLLRFISSLNKQEKDKLVLSQGICRLLASAEMRQQIAKLSHSLGLENWIKATGLNETPINLDKVIDSTAFTNSEREILFPDAASINMSEFCHLLISKIPANQKKFHFNSKVTKLHFEEAHWHFETPEKSHKYKHVVFCGGAKSPLLKQLITWPLNISRGQTSYINHPVLSNLLDKTLCEKVYLVPRENGDIHIGATFDYVSQPTIDEKLDKKSQNEILGKAKKLMDELALPFLSQAEIEQQELTGTLGYRLHSQDRLPLIGGAPNKSLLKGDFDNLGQSKIPRQDIKQYNQQGLWLNTAYGSHGLLYALLGSQHLASQLCNGISPIDTQLSQALNPARFIIKGLKTKS